MRKLPHAILFDLDGTLLENSEVVVDAYFTGLERYGYPPKERTFIATLAGLSTRETARRLDVQEGDWDRIDGHFWEYFHKFADNPETKPIVFDKVLEVLQFFHNRDVKIAVVTSNEASIAKKLINKTVLAPYITTFVGAEDVSRKKPHAEPILLALERLGFAINTEQDNTGEFWMVGDTSSDIGAAKNCGIKGISIPQPHTYSSSIAAEPDMLVDSMVDFHTYLTGNYQ